MSKLFWIILAFLAGAFLPVQAGLNIRLGKAAESPMHAAAISFIVGMIGLIVYIILTQQTISWAGLRSAPPIAWLGGLLGAFYVAVIILAFPHLGPGLTFGLVVAGQMLVSALLEHFNILVAQQQPMSALRLLGMVLIVIGVILMRRY